MVMSHVLSREKREQVIALGRLGWSLRRIERATGVRRDVGRRPASIFAAPGLRFAVLVDGGGIVPQNRPSMIK